MSVPTQIVGTIYSYCLKHVAVSITFPITQSDCGGFFFRLFKINLYTVIFRPEFFLYIARAENDGLQIGKLTGASTRTLSCGLSQRRHCV